MIQITPDTFILPQGTTENLDFELPFYDEDGALTADSLAGLTIGIEITDKDRTTVTGAGTPSIVDAAARKVRFEPTGVNLTRAGSPYAVRWTFSAGSPGDLFKVPNGVEPHKWQIVSP